MIPAGKEARCGVACCHPSCLLPLINIKVFTTFYSISGLLTSSLALYIVSQVTTIERQFNLSSTQTGWLMSCNDIGYCVSILFASYFANKLHVPRILCMSTILYGLSGVLCSVPHFIGSSNIPNSQTASNVSAFRFGMSLCTDYSGQSLKRHPLTSVNMSVPSLPPHNDDASSTTRIAFALLSLGMIMQGIGKAPRYPMLAQFLDDNTKKQDTGFYMGIITSVAIFGPAIAYGLGGVFSQVYVSLEEVDIHPRDPRWIGAWWLGFLSFGVAAIVAALPLMCFPRKLNGPINKWYRGDNRRRTKMTCGAVGRQIIGFFKSVSRVLMTPVFTLTLVGSILTILTVGSFMSFGPKYMELQFNIPTWKANVILAGTGILSVCIGTFLGGLLTKKIKMNPRRCLILLLCSNVPTMILMLISMFLACDPPTIQHWSASNRSSVSSLACNNQCGCDDGQYLPVCGSDGNNYFSPCHAGCLVGTMKKLSNCSCIPGGEATPGLCPTDCQMLWPWNAVSFIASVLSSCAMMPTFLLFLRSVPDKTKSLAIGVSALTSSLIGWLPAPVIGGRLVDATCLLWKSVGGARGACSMYDIDQLRYNIYSMALSGKTIALLFFIMAFVKARNMHEWPKDETEDDVDHVVNIYNPKGKRTESDVLMEKK